MARGARRFYAYQSVRTIPDEWCDATHTHHVVCGMPITSDKVLVVEAPGRAWLDLWPWCDTCCEYVQDPQLLTTPTEQELADGDTTAAGEETDPAAARPTDAGAATPAAPGPAAGSAARPR
jgi:hypothetical protein